MSHRLDTRRLAAPSFRNSVSSAATPSKNFQTSRRRKSIPAAPGVKYASAHNRFHVGDCTSVTTRASMATMCLLETELNPLVPQTKWCSFDDDRVFLITAGKYPNMMSSWCGSVCRKLLPENSLQPRSILATRVFCTASAASFSGFAARDNAHEARGHPAASCAERSSSRFLSRTESDTSTRSSTVSSTAGSARSVASCLCDSNLAAPSVRKKAARGSLWRAVAGKPTCGASSTASRTTCAFASPAAQMSATHFGL
mmetsp:Transcript_78137/g.211351  ORF Transcript_78137/g.211351 Transcript_78137/m.211351 type:complete len:256 (+) Transcript_78137:1179-1946(+)